MLAFVLPLSVAVQAADVRSAQAAVAGVLVAPPVVTGGAAAAGAIASGGGAAAAPIGVATAAANGVAIAGLGVGFAIGWAGTQAVSWVWDKYKIASQSSGSDSAVCSAPGLIATVTAGGTHTGFFCTSNNKSGSFPTASTGAYIQKDQTLTRRCVYSGGYIRYGEGDGQVQTSTFQIGMTCPLGFTPNDAEYAQAAGQRLVRIISSTAVLSVGPITEGIPTAMTNYLRCQDSTGAITRRTVNQLQVYITSVMAGESFSFPAATCPDGSHVVGVEWVPTYRDDAPAGAKDDAPLGGWSPTPDWTDTKDEHAQCKALAGSNPCQVQPLPAPGGGTVTWGEVDPETGLITNPDGSKSPSPGCTWGTYTLTAAECFVDPDPGPTPSPTATPTATPTVSPSPSDSPTASPSPTTSTTTSPSPTASTCAGTVAEPCVVTIPGGAPDPAAEGSECWPSGWGVFNPLEWVYRPVRCALVWAFVPSEPLGPQVSEIGSTIAATPPLSWPADLWSNAFPSASTLAGWDPTCPDWTVHVGGYSKNVVCDSSYIRALQAGRPLLLAFMCLVAVAPFMRSLFYAVIPFVKPVPVR
ncbi:hypothetical protein [Kineococcus sp. SYSU DK018]|uniref:hypothetical protein n=1 Tax=Kineococcus sp. SYSU DK018 TaxID=3383139 RepID=UPI003D7C5676